MFLASPGCSVVAWLGRYAPNIPALDYLTSRGKVQEYIFRDDADRDAFLAILSAVVERFQWKLYACCLMDNHYHLT